MVEKVDIPLGSRPETDCLLHADSVSVSFGGLRALRDVTLGVRRGEVVSIIGPNGAGKTTLFNALCGLVGHEGGSIVFEGSAIQGLTVVERSRLGIVRTFQRIELFDELTVAENLLAARELGDRAGMMRGVFRPGTRISEGLATDVAEILAYLKIDRLRHTRAGDLPTGMRRLVELARALMARPRLLLLDEPTAGLDPSETEEFRGIIADLRDGWGGVSVVLVEHDMSVALVVADYVYVLDRGQLIAHGVPEEIRANQQVQAAYLGVGA